MAQAARRVSIDEKTNAQYDQAGISGDFNQNKNRFARDKTKNVQFDTQVEAANDREHQIGQPQLEIHQGGRAARQPKRETATKQAKLAVVQNGKEGNTVVARITHRTLSFVLWPAYALQFLFAVINTIFFGILALALELADSWIGFLPGIGKIFKDLPGGAYIATLGLLMFFGTLMMAGVAIAYKDFQPLSGKSAGKKMAVLIVSIFGFVTPVLNFLPWAIIWSDVIYGSTKK